VRSIRYSTLTRINRDNVAKLAPPGLTTPARLHGVRATVQPDHRQRVMYATTPKLRLIARTPPPANCSEISIRSKPEVDRQTRNAASLSGRAVRSTHPAHGSPLPDGGQRAHRKLVDSFGDHGRVDLREGSDATRKPCPSPPPRRGSSTKISHPRQHPLRRIASRPAISAPMTSGRRKSSGPPYDSPSGESSRNLAKTRGRPRSANPGGMAGLKSAARVAPTRARQAYDFYGANRHGDNLFANCCWHSTRPAARTVVICQPFNTDVWKIRDFPSPPALVTCDATATDDAVADHSPGFVFVFERGDRASAVSIEYRATPHPTSMANGCHHAAVAAQARRRAPAATTEEMLTGERRKRHARRSPRSASARGRRSPRRR